MVKSGRAVGLGAVLALVSAGGWLACSSDNTPVAGADGGKDASGSSSGGSSGSSSGSSSSGGSGSSSGSSSGGSSGSSSGGSSGSSSGGSSGSSSGSSGGSDAGDAGTVDCTSYCNLIQQVCTGANQQYQSNAECMNACPYIPLADAATGNTLLCHYTHAGLAMAMPVPHCWHAGPYGYGVCGDQCGDFCQLATNYCTPDGGFDSGTPPYASPSACATACAGFAQVAGDSGVVNADGGYYANGPTSGPTLDCREYHLGAALTGHSATMQQLHCNHVGMTSATCF